MTTSTCAICFDSTDVQIVDISGRMVGLCLVHNNPAAITDLQKLTITVTSLPVESSPERLLPPKDAESSGPSPVQTISPETAGETQISTQ